MSLAVAIQMDPIEKVDIETDSIFVLGIEAQRRGHDVTAVRPGDRVLIVDDSGMARRFTRQVLENVGFGTIVEAENGARAVEVMDQTMVDLVVTDYNMPEMDGRALVEYSRPRSCQNSVPIVMVTSEPDRNRLAAVQDMGVVGVCDKPFEPGTVKRLLRGLLA